jgi:hypothetical protein
LIAKHRLHIHLTKYFQIPTGREASDKKRNEYTKATGRSQTDARKKCHYFIHNAEQNNGLSAIGKASNSIGWE